MIVATNYKKLMSPRRWVQSIAYKYRKGVQRGTDIWHNMRAVHKMRHKLVVLDDVFPNLKTGFRICEFNAYLEQFPECEIYTVPSAFKENIAAYREHYPHLAARVFPLDPRRDLAGRLIYCVFLNNAANFLPVIEKHHTPFIFTLYPGGGFGLDNPQSDARLAQVCRSPYLRKVITTQTISRDYLLQKGFCRPEQIEFIYGGVFPLADYGANHLRKVFYPQDKATLDVCFVAYKYTPSGVDKGYDVFLETARLLAVQWPQMRFHVVGNFTEADFSIAGLEGKITFYGTCQRDFFTDFYPKMDIILSPNAPFLIHEGSFDGFPTGCCMEAGYNGVAVFCSDPLNLNIAFQDGEEIVIIPSEAAAAAARITDYCRHPAQLYRLSAKGQQALARTLATEDQLAARSRLFAGADGWH